MQSFANKASINSKFLGILLKITGIAIITEFAVSICKDSGENAIASKIDLGGKIIIMSVSIPIISSLIEMIIKVIPWKDAITNEKNNNSVFNNNLCKWT